MKSRDWLNRQKKDYFVKKASDLQMIEAVLDCYENYKALKKGKIERSRLPEKKGN